MIGQIYDSWGSKRNITHRFGDNLGIPFKSIKSMNFCSNNKLVVHAEDNTISFQDLTTGRVDQIVPCSLKEYQAAGLVNTSLMPTVVDKELNNEEVEMIDQRFYPWKPKFIHTLYGTNKIVVIGEKNSAYLFDLDTDSYYEILNKVRGVKQYLSSVTSISSFNIGRQALIVLGISSYVQEVHIYTLEGKLCAKTTGGEGPLINQFRDIISLTYYQPPLRYSNIGEYNHPSGIDWSQIIPEIVDENNNNDSSQDEIKESLIYEKKLMDEIIFLENEVDSDDEEQEFSECNIKLKSLREELRIVERKRHRIERQKEIQKALEDSNRMPDLFKCSFKPSWFLTPESYFLSQHQQTQDTTFSPQPTNYSQGSSATPIGSTANSHYDFLHLHQLSPLTLEDLKDYLMLKIKTSNFVVARRENDKSEDEIYDLVYLNVAKMFTRLTIKKETLITGQTGYYISNQQLLNDEEHPPVYESLYDLIKKQKYLKTSEECRDSMFIAAIDKKNFRIQILKYNWCHTNLFHQSLESIKIIGGSKNIHCCLYNPTSVAYSFNGELSICDEGVNCIFIFSPYFECIKMIRLQFQSINELQIGTRRKNNNNNKNNEEKIDNELTKKLCSSAFSHTGQFSIGYKSGGVYIFDKSKSLSAGNFDHLSKTCLEKIVKDYLTYSDISALRNCCRFLHNFTKELRIGFKIRPPLDYFFASEEEKEKYSKWKIELKNLIDLYKYGDEPDEYSIIEMYSSINTKSLPPIITNFNERTTSNNLDYSSFFNKSVIILQNLLLYDRILLKRMNKERFRRKWLCNITPLRFIELSRMKNGIDKMKQYELIDKYHRPICKYFVYGRCLLTSQFNKKIKKIKNINHNTEKNIVNHTKNSQPSNSSSVKLTIHNSGALQKKKNNVITLTPMQLLQKATHEYQELVESNSTKDVILHMTSTFDNFKEKYSITLPKKIDDIETLKAPRNLLPTITQNNNNNNYFKYNIDEINAKFKDKYIEPKDINNSYNIENNKFLNSIELTEEEENNSDYEDIPDDDSIKNILLLDKSQANSVQSASNSSQIVSNFVNSKKNCVNICPYSHSDIMFDFIELKLVDTFLFYDDFISIVIELFGSKYLWRNEILINELFLVYSDKINIQNFILFSTKKEMLTKNCLAFDSYIELILILHEDNIGHKSLLEHKLFKNIPSNIKKNYLIRKKFDQVCTPTDFYIDPLAQYDLPIDVPPNKAAQSRLILTKPGFENAQRFEENKIKEQRLILENHSDRLSNLLNKFFN